MVSFIGVGNWYIRRKPPSCYFTVSRASEFLPLRGVASLEEDNLVEFYYLSASEIWPDKMDGLQWEMSYKRGTTVYCNFGTNLSTGLLNCSMFLGRSWRNLNHLSPTHFTPNDNI